MIPRWSRYQHKTNWIQAKTRGIEVKRAHRVVYPDILGQTQTEYRLAWFARQHLGFWHYGRFRRRYL